MTLSPHEKAKQMLTSFAYGLLERGHTISKPLVKLCVLLAIHEILEATVGNKDEYDENWLAIKQEAQAL
jgi:hypothetical protein